VVTELASRVKARRMGTKTSAPDGRGEENISFIERNTFEIIGPSVMIEGK